MLTEVLGQGSDGEYNASDGTVKLRYEAVTTPVRVAVARPAGSQAGPRTPLEAVQIAAGARHCAAVGADGAVFTS